MHTSYIEEARRTRTTRMTILYQDAISAAAEQSRGKDIDEIVITEYTVSFGPNWKNIIFLPFYRICSYAFIIMTYCSIMIAIYILTFQPTGFSYEMLSTIHTFIEICYLFRTLLALLHRYFYRHRRRKIHRPEGMQLLLIEILTLIPVANYCTLINQFMWNDQINEKIGHYYCYAMKLPRIYRLFHMYRMVREDLSRNPKTVVIVAHIMLSALLIMILSSMYYTIFYYSESRRTWANTFPALERQNITYITPVICFLYSGSFYYKDILTPTPSYSMNEMVLAGIAIFLGYVAHNVFLTSQLVAIYVQLMRFKHFFEWRLLKVGTFIKLLHFDEGMQDTINTYYRTIWITRHGFIQQPEIVNLFPLQLKTEIAMDLYFDAIRHSKIFAPLNDSFKKELSRMFKTEVYIPGQLLYKKGRVKSKMVYLHSGIVEVMSNESRDSPVLSFSPGTVLGEVSCILPYRGDADIRCSTTCVVHFLNHRSLCVLLARDKELNEMMRDEIFSRIEYARTKLARMRHLENPMSHIYWIKKRWRRLLLSSDNNKALKNTDTMRSYYCSRYLNLLVLSSYYELKMHSICVRANCSFVLEQDSSFRRFLHNMHLIIVVIHFALTFHNIIFVGYISSQLYALLSVFDLVFVMDIYVQAITAVRVQSLFISKPMDILVYRFKQGLFLLDLFTAVPYDYFALIMSSEDFAVGLCRIPKFIKLYKVVDYFSNKERSLTFSMKKIKIGKSIAIHTILIFSFLCLLYLDSCFNGRCKPLGWMQIYKAESLNKFQKNVTIDDFSITLMYTTSLYLQMKMHHIYPKIVWDVFAQFVISVAGFYALNMTLIQLTGAVALDNYPRFLYLWNLSYLDSMMSERTELRKFRSKIYEFISLQWFFSNNMQFNDIAILMNYDSKFIKRRVSHQFIINNLRRTQFFSNLSDEFLRTIAGKIELYIIPPGHTLQMQNSNACFLYIMLDGYCRVRSYAPDDYEKRRVTFLQTYDVFPVIAFFHNVKSFITVETYTTVKVFCLSHTDFENTARAIFADGLITKRAIAQHLKDHHNLILRIVHLPLLHYPPQVEKEQQDAFEFLTAAQESKDHLRWKRQDHQSLRHRFAAIFKCTYDPHGRYLYYEVVRCLIIMVDTVLVYLALHQHVRTATWFRWMRSITLLSYIVDMFVRSRVQYFTPEGVRVTDTNSTWKHYLNHSFTTDFLSGFPYQRFHVLEIFRGRHKNTMDVIFSLHTKPVALYRPYLFSLMIRKTIGIQYHNTIISIANSTIFLFLIAQLSAYAMIFTCTLTETWEWECPEDSWIRYVANWEYWNENDYLLSRTFYEVTILSRLRSAKYFSFNDCMAFFCFAIVISMAHVYYCALLIGYNVFSTKYLANFQDRRRIYQRLASRLRIPRDIRNELMNHYKYKFKKTQTDEPDTIVRSFYPYLREKIQLALYRPALSEAKIFVNVPPQCYSYIVPYLNELYFKKDALIITCNDIVNSMYFVKKGYVEIFLAGHSTTVLGVGGVFGCFASRGVMRMTISAVAKIHSEILVIDTKKFYETTSGYPSIKAEMKMANLVFQEYIESFERCEINTELYTKSKCSATRWYQYTFDDHNTFIMFYRYFTEMHLAPIVSIFALVAMVLNTLGDSDNIWAFCDLYFLIDMYMTCHVGHTDVESGLMVTKVEQLTKKYVRSWKFYIDLLTLIPFYAFKSQLTYKYDGVVVINKSLRITNMFVYYRSCLRTRYLPNHVRFTFLFYMLLFCLNAVFIFLWAATIILYDRGLNNQETIEGYLYVVNVFTNAGIDPVEIQTITQFFCYTFIVMSCTMLLVWMVTGFSKLTLMIFYRELDFRRAVITFKVYCNNEYISKPIIDQSWVYLMHLYSLHGGEQFPELIMNSPNYIRQAHMTFLCQDLMINHSLFKHAHHDFIRQMLVHMNYEFIMPGFTIVDAGDKKKRMYFIAEGTVLSIAQTPMGSNYQVLDKGRSFGELQAMRDMRFSKTFKALTPCQVFYLKTKSWVSLMEWFPATAKTLNELVDQGVQSRSTWMPSTFGVISRSQDSL